MNGLKIAGKFLDQPILVAKFKKAVPYLLTVGGSAYCISDIKRTENDNKKKYQQWMCNSIKELVALSLYQL